MDDMPELNLVAESIQQGDFEAYKRLFVRYYAVVRTFVGGFVKDEEVAKDIAQDVFMKLWQYRNSIDCTLSIKHYIFLLARREVCSWFRTKREQMYRNSEDVESVQISDDSLQQSLERGDLQSTIERIIDAMPPQRKTVFRLSRIDGLSNKEIAEHLNISVRTVDKHIELALQNIKKHIKF